MVYRYKKENFSTTYQRHHNAPSLVRLPTRVADVNGYLDEWLSARISRSAVFAHLLPIEAANALRSRIAHSLDAKGSASWTLLGKLLAEREYGDTSTLTEKNRATFFILVYEYKQMVVT